MSANASAHMPACRIDCPDLHAALQHAQYGPPARTVITLGERGSQAGKQMRCAGWTQAESKLLPAKQGPGPKGSVTIVRRFHFSSTLKRMSCIVKVLPIPAEHECRPRCLAARCKRSSLLHHLFMSRHCQGVREAGCVRVAHLAQGRAMVCTARVRTSHAVWQVEEGSELQNWVVAKGAPEVILQHLATVPANYESCYKSFAAQGARSAPMPSFTPCLQHACAWAQHRKMPHRGAGKPLPAELDR